jgi:type IV secretion system protein VirD4
MKPHTPEMSDDLFVNVVAVLACAFVVLGTGVYLATWAAAVLWSWSWQAAGSAEAGRFVGELLNGRSPSRAWAGTGSPPPNWLVAVIGGVLLATATIIGESARRVVYGQLRGRNFDARWATARDERLVSVPDDRVKRPHRLVAGRSKATRRCLAGEDCVSAVVFGPNGSGKTAGLIIPNTLEWLGSVVMTTAKPQDLTPVLGARALLGPVWVVAPGAAPGTPTASWSPVDYATDADSADRMAGWLVDSSGMTGDPRARPWNAQARKYLKGLLLAAKLSGRGMKGFVEWAYEGELASEHVSQILSQHGYVDVLREYRSTWRIHEEGKGSVMFTAFGLADTYNRPGVIGSSQHSDFAASDLFAERPATLLLSRHSRRSSASRRTSPH